MLSTCVCKLEEIGVKHCPFCCDHLLELHFHEGHAFSDAFDLNFSGDQGGGLHLRTEKRKIVD